LLPTDAIDHGTEPSRMCGPARTTGAEGGIDAVET